MNKRPNKRLDVLNEIAEWTKIVAEFRRRLGQKSVGEHADKIYRIEIGALERALDSKNLRGIRTMCHDDQEWARGLPATYFGELDRLLRNRLGRGLLP